MNWVGVCWGGGQGNNPCYIPPLPSLCTGRPSDGLQRQGAVTWTWFASLHRCRNAFELCVTSAENSNNGRLMEVISLDDSKWKSKQAPITGKALCCLLRQALKLNFYFTHIHRCVLAQCICSTFLSSVKRKHRQFFFTELGKVPGIQCLHTAVYKDNQN